MTSLTCIPAMHMQLCCFLVNDRQQRQRYTKDLYTIQPLIQVQNAILDWYRSQHHGIKKAVEMCLLFKAVGT